MRPVHKSVLSLALVVFIGTGLAAGISGAQEGVRVCAVMATKGVFSKAFIECNDGLKDCLAMANEAGGINGRRIHYFMEDTDYNVQESEAKLEQLWKTHRPLAMFGNSTGLSQAIAEKITKEYKTIYTSTSYSAVIANEGMYPSMFLAGPTYGQQVGILLTYIAKVNPGAKVALFYSDSEFGRDPIAFTRFQAQRLRLNLVTEQVVKLGAKDFTQQMAGLKAANPDFVIFHGFVLDPVPEVIKLCREQDMKCKFMGTFWGATKDILDKLGPLSDGYLVVNPYSYWWNEEAPMIRKIREFTAKNHPDVQYRSNYYMQGFCAG
ncbi:MAG: ABC transporter substrate-binding protein, partial [Pseudomonadota bacterium]